MPRHEHSTDLGKIAGRGSSVLRIAAIIPGGELDGPAQHPTLGIDIANRPFGALLHLLAEAREITGHGAGEPNYDRIVGNGGIVGGGKQPYADGDDSGKK